MAFQLEINRLSNFSISAIPCHNHRMHLYLGSAKVAAGQPVTDYRFFIRTIIRHSDFVTRVSVHVSTLHIQYSQYNLSGEILWYFKLVQRDKCDSVYNGIHTLPTVFVTC